jgi:hypothetical protein
LPRQFDQRWRLTAEQPAIHKGTSQAVLFVELVDRIGAEVDAAGASRAESNDDVLCKFGDVELRPLRQSNGFAKQVFTVLFIPGHGSRGLLLGPMPDGERRPASRPHGRR